MKRFKDFLNKVNSWILELSARRKRIILLRIKIRYSNIINF